MKEHLKSIVWRYPPIIKDGKENHRYVIVGMLVTDELIPELEYNEIVLDGNSKGLSKSLTTIKQRNPNRIVGDATNVLITLGDI